MMTEAEVKKVAEDAAEGALHKFMLLLGVDVSTPAAMIELQRDFTHLRQERLTFRNIRDKVWASLAGCVVTGVVSAVVWYVTHAPK